MSVEPSQPRLGDLLLEWEERRGRGEYVTAESLYPGHPERNDLACSWEGESPLGHPQGRDGGRAPSEPGYPLARQEARPPGIVQGG
jgi:hypothetical protein